MSPQGDGVGTGWLRVGGGTQYSSLLWTGDRGLPWRPGLVGGSSGQLLSWGAGNSSEIFVIDLG